VPCLARHTVRQHIDCCTTFSITHLMGPAVTAFNSIVSCRLARALSAAHHVECLTQHVVVVPVVRPWSGQGFDQLHLLGCAGVGHSVMQQRRVADGAQTSGCGISWQQQTAAVLSVYQSNQQWCTQMQSGVLAARAYAGQQATSQCG